MKSKTVFSSRRKMVCFESYTTLHIVVSKTRESVGKLHFWWKLRTLLHVYNFPLFQCFHHTVCHTSVKSDATVTPKLKLFPTGGIGRRGRNAGKRKKLSVRFDEKQVNILLGNHERLRVNERRNVEWRSIWREEEIYMWKILGDVWAAGTLAISQASNWRLKLDNY
jgi:hypothetical protein